MRGEETDKGLASPPDNRARFSLASFPELTRGVMEIRPAPPPTHLLALLRSNNTWLSVHSRTARKTSRPFPLRHHPTVLVFGARQMQVLILAPPQGSRTSISGKRLHHKRPTLMQLLTNNNTRGHCAGAEGARGSSLCFLLSFSVNLNLL